MARAGRSDARRNRGQLLLAAAAAFEADGGPVSLEAIARDAGVGIGTLYRHFPTREALVEAVYRARLAEVCASADQLLDICPPATALRLWMDRYASFVAAKRGMAESLSTILVLGAAEPNESRDAIIGAVDKILHADTSARTLRHDVRADDVVACLLGVTLASRSQDQTQRLLDLVADALKAEHEPHADPTGHIDTSIR